MPALLDSYAEKWKLQAAELITETYMGKVYKVESPHGEAVLKIYNQPGKYDGLHSIEALKQWNGNGAVQIYDYDPDAVLLEYAGSVDLLTLVQNGQDDQATEIAAGVMQKLYAAKFTEPGLLIPLSDRYARLVQPMPAHLPAVFGRSKDVLGRLLAEQESPRILHGDLHHYNFLHSEKRGWLVIDPRGLYGDRASDAGGAILSPIDFPEIVKDTARLQRRASIFGEILGLSPRKIIGYACLEACVISLWAEEVGFDILAKNALAMALLAEAQLNDFNNMLQDHRVIF